MDKEVDNNSEFVCNNCGFCCTDPSTQINMTLLDIKWLSDYTHLSVKELFIKEIVTFIPFLKTKDFSEFEVEFGMKRACPLYKNNKCEAYGGRPMNCRIFPYWFITNKIEDDLECIKNVKPSPQTFFKYRMYERIIGDMLLKQGKDTEEFIKKIGANQLINFSKEPDLKRLLKIYKKRSLENDKTSIRLSRKLMKLAETKVNKKMLNQKIDLIDKEISNMNFDKEIEILLNAEAILEGEVTDVKIDYGTHNM